MKFFILSGSHRVEAQSLKVANYIKSVLTREHSGAEAYLYSLSGNPLPLWDETTGGAPDALWDPISTELKSSDVPRAGACLPKPDRRSGPEPLQLLDELQLELAHLLGAVAGGRRHLLGHAAARAADHA